MVRKYTGVEERGETSIQITFQYQSVRCRETVHLKPTPANLRRASHHRAKVLHEIDLGTFDYAQVFPDSPNLHKFVNVVRDISVEEQLRAWLDAKLPQIKASTRRGYKKIVFNQLIPAFGDISIFALKTANVRDWLVKDCPDMSNKRIRNVISPLRCALELAYTDEILEKNVLNKWYYARAETAAQVDKRDQALDPFDTEERDAILAAASPQARNFILFAFWTGMRTSEMVALQWSDIDFKKGFIRVNKALTQDADEAEPPKTKAGYRRIKMFNAARRALLAQKAHTFLADEYVFHNPKTGEPWVGDAAIRKTMWTPILRKAGVRYRRPYQTRHTFASMMITAGEKIGWISRTLGHKKISVTLDIYARWLDEEDALAGNAAEAMFGDAGSTPKWGIELPKK